MRPHRLLATWLWALVPALLFGQGAAELAPPLPPPVPNAPPPSLQAAADPGYAALVATCRMPPGRGGGPGRAGGRGPAPAPGPREYTIREIPGVIAGGQRWKFVWQEAGNNGDGIVGTNDGGLLIAQNDNSKVVKLDKNGKPSVVYTDTHTGGSLSISKKGDVFVVQRGLKSGILQLAPRRRQLANSYQGDPLDCVGGNPNDLSADSKGGVYFTQGGVYYADSKGTITKYGENITPNGIILSADEKTLYVTNAGSVAAFEVQPDGSLKNQREFVKLPTPGGDGLTIDSQGRLYVTAGPALHVVSPDGKLLGSIPAPYGLITAAFAGPDKKTVYAVVSLIDPMRLQHAYVYSIPMLAQGYMGRAK
jgi:gluconolactonase